MKAPSTTTTVAGRSHQGSVRRAAPAATPPRAVSREVAGSCAGPLELQLLDELAYRRRRLVEGGLLLGGELDLDDLLDAGPAELDRHAHVEPLGPVLAVEIGGAGQDLLLVLEDGLDHLHRGGGGRVVGAPGLQQRPDLRPARGGGR